MKKLKRALGVFGGHKAPPKERKEKSESRKSSCEVVPVPSTSQSTPKQPRGESVLQRLESKAYESSDSESNSRCSPVRAYGNPPSTEDSLFTKLHRAAYQGDLEKIKKALQKIDINCEDADRRTPLHLCASGGHSEALTFLIASGAKIEAEDKDGRTPFLRAVEKGHIQAVQTFLQHQVNAFARDLFNNTGLHVAAQAKSQPLVELLIEVGLDYDLPDVKGQTPLHIAAANLDMEVVSSLLCNGANGNAMDREGVTALMLASKQGFQPLVELLLEFEANPDLMDCSGWSAASYAKYCGYLELHNFLQRLMTMDLASKVKMNKRLSVSLGAGLKKDFSQALENVPSAESDVNENSWKDSSSCSSVEPLEKMDLEKFMAMSNDSLQSKDDVSNTSRSEGSLDNSIADTVAGPPKPPRSFGSTPDLSENLEILFRSPTLRSNMSSPNFVSLHENDYKEGGEEERKELETKEVAPKRKSIESNSILASLSSTEVSFGDETDGLSLGVGSPLKIKDSSLEEDPIKPSISPNASFGGTLGRRDTLQEMEEIWESNGSLSHRKVITDDSEVSSASSTKSNHTQENDEERLDELQIKKRFFGDSKENVGLEDTFDFRRPSFAAMSRKRTLSRSSLFEKISVRRDSLLEVIEDSPLRKSSSFIEPDKDPTNSLDEQNIEKTLATILKFKEIPVDLEELHFIIRNLRIHLNREETKKKNCLAKIKWSEKINESLKNELKERDEIIREHKEMVQELQTQKTEITYDLNKQKEETHYFSALLKESEMELRILQGNNANLKSDNIRQNNCIQNLQDELERKAIVLSAQQSKLENMSSISDRKEAVTQTSSPPSVCIGSQTDTVNEFQLNKKVEANKVASTSDKEVQCEETNKKEENIKTKSLLPKTKRVQKSTQTPCISVASSLIQTDDFEEEVEDMGIFPASESTSKSVNDIEDSARGSTRTTDFSLSSVGIQTENDSVLSKPPQNILDASKQAKVNVLDSSSQTKTNNFEISSQTEINVSDESSQTKTDVTDNCSQANPNLKDNECQTKIELSDEICLRNVDDQENSPIQKVLLDKNFQTEIKTFSNNLNTIECYTQTQTKVFSNNSSQVTIDISDCGVQAVSNTTNLDISSQTPLIEMMSVSCQNSLENIIENSSQTSNDFNNLNKTASNETSIPPALITHTVNKYSANNNLEDKFSQTMKQTNTSDFDGLQKLIILRFDQLSKDITENIMKSSIQASDTATNAIFEMKSTSETIRDDIEKKIHQKIDILHKDLSTKISSWFEQQNEKESSEVSRTLSIEKEIVQMKEGLTKQLDNIFVAHRETSLKNDQAIDLLNQDVKLTNMSLERSNSLPNTISEVVNKSLEGITSILSNMAERSVKHEENVTPSLERLKSNLGEITKNMASNEESLEKLKEDLEISIKQQKGQESLIRKVKIFEEHWAQETLEEIITSIERVIKENDHQIHTNLRKTLNNIDETVGANFEIVETLIHSLKNDLAKKVNEISNEKVEGIENTDQKFEKLFNELKNLNGSLLTLRSITESQNDTTHSKSIFDPDIIEAIRGGNDQALTAIQAQNSSVLKLLEHCECSLKKLSESQFSSMERIALESEHETEKRELLKEIELLKNMISSTESLIDVERKRFNDEKERRLKLDNELDSLRTANERQKEENSNLKVNFLNLKNEFENMISRTLRPNRSDASSVTETGYNNLGQVNLIETVSRPRKTHVETDYKNLIQDLEKELNYLKETNEINIEEKAGILNEIEELKRLSREQMRSKEMEVKALESNLSKSNDQKLIAEKEIKVLLKENEVLRDQIRKAEEAIKSKSKIIKNNESKITELKTDLNSLDMDLTTVSQEKDLLKKENIQFQRKLKLMRQHSEERNNLAKEVQQISTRNEELLNELSHKQALVLNLRERVSSLSQEKVELMEENGKCKETNLSSEIYLKQKEQAEMLVGKLVGEMNSLRENLDENFVPKAKLSALYEELDANFKIMFSKRIAESNSPLMEKISQMERVNRLLKARETELKAELLSFQDQVKILSAKISFANYNAHLWKSKYQELFEEHYNIPRNVFHPQLLQLKEKNVHKTSDRQKPTFNDNILKEVESLLQQPQESSSFLRELDIPDHNTPSVMSFSTASAFSTHEPDNNSNGSSVDICLKKYLKAEKDFNDFIPKKRKNKWIDPTSPTTFEEQMVPSTSMSHSSTESSSSKTLQESLDEYASFLRKS